jgi:hypothetical protein
MRFRLAPPCFVPWAPLRAVSIELGAMLMIVLAIGVLVQSIHRALERGTIQVDRESVRVKIRGLWGRKHELGVEAVRTVRAVCAGLKNAKQRGKPFAPIFMLQIMLWDGEAVELLEAREPAALAALARAMNRALGISRETRRAEWLRRKLETMLAKNGLPLLGYAAEAKGTALEVTSQRVLLSLSPHGLGKAAQFTITDATVSVAGDISQSWNCRDIHWVMALEEMLGLGAMAIILEEGRAEKLFALRPMGELRYAATVLNSALGLTAGEQT